MTQLKNLTPIEYLHPKTLEKIKSDNRIREQYIRERLHYKDYDGLKTLMEMHAASNNPGMDENIINNIFNDKNYIVLRIIIKAILAPEGVGSMMSAHSILATSIKKAIELMDLEAITLILNETSNSKLDVSSLDLFKHLSGPGSLGDLIDRISYTENSAQYKVLAKAFVAAMHKQRKEQLNGAHFIELSHYVSKQEFDKFIEEQKINITNFNVTFQHYDLESGGAVVAKDNEPRLIDDIALQRTYSNSSNIDSIRKAYRELFGSKSSFVKDIMVMLTLNILNGDDVRIFFSNDPSTTSSYSHATNIVEIGLKGNDNCISVASAAIHEMAHYVFHKLYMANAAPFNFYSFRSKHSNNVLNKISEATDGDNIYDGFRGMFNITGYNKISPSELFNDLYFSCGDVEDVHRMDQVVNKLQDYEFGPRTFLTYTLNLLQIENAYDELDQHLSSEDLVEWIKGNVPVLDLFLLHSFDRYHTNSTNHSESVYMNIQNIYAQGMGFDVCPTRTNITNFHNRPLSETIKDFKDYSFMPIVKQYGLTNDHVCFLERTADFVNRHHGKFDAYVSEDDDLELYAELIVRCPEFQALGLDKNIIDGACKDVFAYWEQYVAPDVKAHIENYKASCLSHNQSCNTEMVGDCSLQAKYCGIFFDWLSM